MQPVRALQSTGKSKACFTWHYAFVKNSLRLYVAGVIIATANKIIISVVGNTIVSKLNADEDNPNWYCSELVWAAYYSEGINLNGSTIPNHLYMPDELASSSKLTYRDVE